MNPLSLDLPVRPPDAAALAEVIFDQTSSPSSRLGASQNDKRLTTELRQRIATRAAAFKHPSIIPYFGSLQADPIHPTAFFLAVDGTAMEGESRPLLLRFAPSASPASALFKDTILIGRMRLDDRSEIVVNAIPFGPGDREAIETFVSEIDRSFLPRPQSTGSAILAPVRAAMQAFAGFRQILKARGVNLAAFLGPAEPAIWAAIRSGWREGYSVFAEVIRLENGSLTAVEQLIPESFEATGFVIDPSAIPPAEQATQILAALELIARGRSGHARLKHFDFVLAAENAVPSVPELSALLDALHRGGRTPQSVAPLAGPDAVASIESIRQAGALAFLPSNAPIELLRAAVKAPVGRAHCVLQAGASVLEAADRLRS